MLETVVIKGKGLTTGLEYKGYLVRYPHSELWTLNDDIQVETTVHFDMHYPEHHRNVLDSAYRMPCKFRRLRDVLIAHNSEPVNRKEIRFPLNELKAMLETDTLWINCATCFMVAYAIFLGVKRICMAGVDFRSALEIREGQRECTEEWVKLANHLGIEFINTRRSWLFKENKLTEFDLGNTKLFKIDEIYC